MGTYNIDTMIPSFNTDQFIADHITFRPTSFFNPDVLDHWQTLEHAIKGSAVLVIGGAGTIGSAFIQCLLQFHPGKLIVVDINENGLTELVRTCRSNAELQLPSAFKTYPINFNDRVCEKIVRAEGPFDIVANFAAHKHVRSEKDIYSIEALLKNNVIYAKKLLDQLSVTPPKHFFCVSTDKAANPVNIMGASKKLMEHLIMSYDDLFPITTARFANVAFSNGSLLAGYLERINQHQPLSCPSDVKRYFVSPQEAGEICLLACILGQSSEIFFPKFTATTNLISFEDITHSFLAQLGMSADICASEEEAKVKVKTRMGNKYPVYFFKSETSGEKLQEEFYTESETLDLARFKSLGVISSDPHQDKARLHQAIRELDELFERTPDKAQIVSALQSVIPEFQHIETGMNLDQKM